MGIADDPDVDDYYTRARGFPIIYSPDDDPEVIEEMHVAAAELKKGGDDSEHEAGGDSDRESSTEDETTSDEGEDCAEEDWVDEDENVGEASAGPSKQKRKRKTLLSVDRVRGSFIIVCQFLMLTKMCPSATRHRGGYSSN